MSKLTDDDKNLWTQFIKTVKKLAPDIGTQKKSVAALPEKPTYPKKEQQQGHKRLISQGVDKPQPIAQDKLLRRPGKIQLEGRLDLHGMTKAEAKASLESFILRCQRQGRVWVLVITGKGSITKVGVLRTLVPQWLNQSPFISSFAKAKPQDGGDGALYVRIKKQKR